ncbi:MAG: hypothetical protein M3387_00635, partial [Actinomycetota bacterium]|nr:hypothetical protein [Actinomycetota bacterium]
QMTEHWTALARRLDTGSVTAETLEKGAAAARDLIRELEPVTARYGLYGKPAAQGLGINLARVRTGVRDRFMERNQALRFAVKDVEHLTMLLAYLASVAQSASDTELAEFCGRWERRLRRNAGAARKAAVEQGADPDGAVEPLDDSLLGKAAHSVGYLAGTVGEWVDERADAARRSG